MSMNEKSAELAACPFCGFQPHYSPRTESEEHPGNHWPEQVHCSVCNIIFRTGERGCTDAAKAWNHRHLPSGDVGKLRTALKYYAQPELYENRWGAGERVLVDAGHVARAALASVPVPVNPPFSGYATQLENMTLDEVKRRALGATNPPQVDTTLEGSPTPTVDALAVKWTDVKSDTWYVPRIHARRLERGTRAIRKAFEPVLTWYDNGGNEPYPSLAEMIANAVHDLQTDRADSIRLSSDVHRLERELAHARKSQPKDGVNERLVETFRKRAENWLQEGEIGAIVSGEISVILDALSAESAAVPSMELELAEALRLLVPMANGYAHNNPVGNNWKFVEQSESVLAKFARKEGGK